jgi:hypothetical protein
MIGTYVEEIHNVIMSNETARKEAPKPIPSAPSRLSKGERKEE